VSHFLISALRAIVELLGLCLAGQGILYVIAGRQRTGNRIYQLLELITKAPRQIVGLILPRSASGAVIGFSSFAILLILWLGLAFVRKFV
jgi:hypothetical protein